MFVRLYILCCPLVNVPLYQLLKCEDEVAYTYYNTLPYNILETIPTCPGPVSNHILREYNYTHTHLMVCPKPRYSSELI